MVKNELAQLSSLPLAANGADAEAHSKHEAGREPELEIFVKSLPLELWESHGSGGGKIVGAKGIEDTRRTRPTESTKQG